MSAGRSTEHGIEEEPPATIPAPGSVTTAQPADSLGFGPPAGAPASRVADPALGGGAAPPPAGPDETLDGHAEPGRARRHSRSRLTFLQELPFLLLVAFVLALLIKTFLIQAFYIPSESMDPTLKVGDRVLVNKLTYRFHPPRRGDIVVFEDPHPGPAVHRNPVSGFVHWLGEGLGLSTSRDKDFIKRVIGVPGDVVEVRLGRNGLAQVFVNGKALTEPYLSSIKETRPYGPVTVPKDDLFVMGDNRTNSNDSRYGLGFIPEDKVVGRAFVIIWPPSRFRWLSGIHYP